MRPYLYLLFILLFFFSVFVIFLFFSSSSPNDVARLTDVYFCELVDCIEVIVDLSLDSSRLRCAFFDLDDPRVVDVFENHPDVLVVTDASSPSHDFALHRFGEGLMHHKFCVFDNRLVLTGSFNPVVAGPDDFDSLVLIDSPALARRYIAAFDALLAVPAVRDFSSSSSSPFSSFFSSSFFLSFSSPSFPLASGGSIMPLFCPADPCRDSLLDAIGTAQEEIVFSLFTFTDKEVAAALIRKHAAGVRVRGVVESFQDPSRNQFFVLQEAGIDVVLESSSRLQHNKVFVIDNETVVFGSYNPTISASTINDENLVIVVDPLVAIVFAQHLLFIKERTQSFI